ncbi:Crp/Fnr family transcriptional regulator [Epilithonimonas hungarica]|uniref:cAMP-binding domain of CRP or a regulatory subunit of cAMP-dependent protein kinases n=1 Tax=Epilithonimonas hungarica TaxID=454006 RepID=A0A1G7SGM4_9FLAO|nr:Crp/Fnr family transcriptional regulator [Epilithonimonas hungarica]MDP9955830.1 CRP-like cAMP-binding protein [Epilithonimonas hungarica]SDG22227.1 cAMP-binding domain of CRP or a regulatory subunit of cAMP-dependent protein kinases [Epilithonimonas hungarica]
MLIPEELLMTYGATIENYKRGDVIFSEFEVPKNYYQIISGSIKLNHYNEDGKELIFAILNSGLSVCEMLLFIDHTFPVNAVVSEDAKVLRLSKPKFLQMLDDHPNISRDINKFLAERLYQKYIMLENNSSLYANVRIKGVLEYHKSFSPDRTQYSFQMPLTRQQLAAMTGLRVETVIRHIKNLEKQGALKIVKGKIYY